MTLFTENLNQRHITVNIDMTLRLNLKTYNYIVNQTMQTAEKILF